MPYFPLGNLQDQHSEKMLSKQEAIDLLYQVLNALQYLHARGVVHRDLKPENILVASRTALHVKLADFGLANDEPYLKTLCGTPLYTAPEIYRGKRYATTVDLWSLGVIILGYVYGLPSMDLQIPLRQYQKRGFAWSCRVSDYANGFDSDALLDLLSAGMLRIAPNERLSACDCLMLGHHMGLFRDHLLGSGSATPRPKSAGQGEVGEVDSSTTIILHALWSTNDGVSNRVDENETGPFRTLQHTSQSRQSHTRRAATSPTGSFNYDLQLEGFEPASVLAAYGRPSPVGLPCPPEARSTCTGGSKRLRSPAVGLADEPFSRGKEIRRPRKDRPMKIPVTYTDEIPSQYLRYDGGPTPYATNYNAVLALLTNLWLGDDEGQEMEIDDHTEALIGDLCEHFVRLEVTKLRLARADHSVQVIVAAGSDCQEVVLANLTSSELMSSITDLVMHILHMVQFQSSQLQRTPTVHENDLRADFMAHDDPSQKNTVGTIGKRTATLSTRKTRISHPSEPLDCTNVSVCSKSE